MVSKKELVKKFVLLSEELNVKPLSDKKQIFLSKIKELIHLINTIETEEIESTSKVYLAALELEKKINSYQKELKERLEYNKEHKLGSKIITEETFILLMLNAGNSVRYIESYRTHQIRIIYTLLYVFHENVNNFRDFHKQNLIELVETGSTTVTINKTPKTYVVKKKDQEYFNEIKEDIEILFDDPRVERLGFSTLTASGKIPPRKFLTELLNRDIQQILSSYGYENPEQYKTSSFKLNKY